MFKVVNDASLEIFANLFTKNEQSCYNFRNNRQFSIPKVRTVFNGTESISILGPKIWNALPEYLKRINSVNSFKNEIKKWISECPCRLCKNFIARVGFI